MHRRAMRRFLHWRPVTTTSSGVRALTASLGIGLLLLGSAACGTGAASNSSDTLVFAAIPSEEEDNPRQSYKTVIERLEAATGKTVEVKQTTNYNGVIEGLKSGTVDIGVLGPFSYVLAKKVGAKITPVAALAESKEKPTYLSYGITQGDNADVKSIEDFKGKKVCFGDPASTSSYLFPRAGLKDNDIDPDNDVTPVMAGAHDLSILSVKSGKCDVGFAADTYVDHTMPDKGRIKKGDLKVVWRSVPIPESPVALRDDLPKKVREQVTSTLTEELNKDWLVQNGKCKDAESCVVATDTAYWGYLPIDDKDYAPIRKVCAITKDKQCEGEE